jgi:signal transduction histidine kinase
MTYCLWNVPSTRQIYTGKSQLHFHSIDLVSVIESAIDTVQPTAAAKRIHLSSQPDASVGSVAGDASRLQQMMWHLLTNAVKFTPEGSGSKTQRWTSSTIASMSLVGSTGFDTCF